MKIPSAALLVTILLAGCLRLLGAGQDRPLERVTLQLKWTHAFQFAGYYAAQEMGYYREAGLEVQFQEAVPGTDPVQAVLQGKAEYGVGTSSLLPLRNAGKPVVVLAVILQHSPYVLLARPQAGIQHIHDLVGKRVMIEPLADEIFAYLKKEGLSRDRITLVDHSLDPRDLLEGRVDAQSAYVTHEPEFLDQQRFSYLAFTPRSVGIDFYGDNLFTLEGELKAHPERVRAFREASLRGWNYAMTHPEELADLILARYSRLYTREHLLFEARQMATLMRPELVEIGYINPGRWRHIADTYADLGMLGRDVSLAGFLYDPNPRKNLTWAYRAFGGAVLLVLLVGGIAAYYVRLTRALRISEERHRLLADNAADVIWTMDLEGRITYVSPSVENLRGYTAAEVMGQSIAELLTPESARLAEEGLRSTLEALQKGQPVPRTRGELEQPCKDGTTVWTEATTTGMTNVEGKFIGILGVTRDISERRRLQEELAARAATDALTGVWNRARLEDQGRLEVQRFERYGHSLSLVFLDLDHFKQVNDRHGHAAGDAVLKGFCEVTLGCLRGTDSLGRWGGEEFLILAPSTEIANIRLLAERIRIAMEGHVFPRVGRVTASLGIAECRPGDTWESLVARADAGLYRAKEMGRNRVEVEGDELHSAGGPFLRLAWSEAYACGQPLIDAQHRDLFDGANHLLQMLQERRSIEEIAVAIAGLLGAVEAHFETELQLLRAAGYAGAEAHAEIHRNLLQRGQAMAEQHGQGILNPGDLFTYLAYEIVAQHMLKEDLAFFPIFQSTGPNVPDPLEPTALQG
ncbi:MAG: ABC transporter substrate-binding protein [Holophaga sp.]|nr:ABC transporter substrate-binding protein [Holophaga sp.]